MRRLVAVDLERVAEIHCRAFADSVLSLVGEAAVADYYRWVVSRRPNGRGAFVALDGSRIVGFCIGGPGGAGMRLFLRAHGPRLLLGLARKPWLLARASVRRKLRVGLQVITRRGKRVKRGASTLNANEEHRDRAASYAILAIASDPAHRAAGVGRALLAAAEFEARELGMSRMHLTVAPENRNAIGFYEHLAWQRVPATDGSWQGEMRRRLNS